MRKDDLWGFAIPSLAIAYFLLFVPLSLLGIHDKNMLAVFNLDEYAQYGEMLGRAVWYPPTRKWVDGFFDYGNTQYGYLFSLMSSLVVLFFQTLSHFTGRWDTTPVCVFILRQLCVSCFILGTFYLSKMFSDREDRSQRVIIFGFLLLVSGPFALNSLWKPDQGVYLLVALGLYWISRAMDAGSSATRELLLGTFFFGMAAGFKAYGWFAGPLILLTIFLAWGPRFWREPIRLLNLGGVFICGFLVSQPVMIWPPTAWQVIERLQTSISNSTQAKDMVRMPGYLTTADLPHWYQNSFHNFYGHWIFLIAALAAAAAGVLLEKQRRHRYLAVLVWFVPISIYVVTQIVYTGEQRYWLPMWMPVFAAFLSFCFWVARHSRLARFGLAAWAIVALLPVWQAAAYIRNDAADWMEQVNRQKVSPAIFFYHKVEDGWLSKLPKDRAYAVFRDPYIYLPPMLAGFKVRMRYKDTTYADILEIPTDILLLDTDYIRLNASNVDMDRKKASRILWDTYLFYSDVRDDKVKGFRKIYQDKWGIFFVSDALYRRLPQSFWK